MKITHLYIAAAIAVLGTTFCVDLDRYPLEELSDKSFWRSPDDAEKAVSNLAFVDKLFAVK